MRSTRLKKMERQDYAQEEGDMPVRRNQKIKQEMEVEHQKTLLIQKKSRSQRMLKRQEMIIKESAQDDPIEIEFIDSFPEKDRQEKHTIKLKEDPYQQIQKEEPKLMKGQLDYVPIDGEAIKQIKGEVKKKEETKREGLYPREVNDQPLKYKPNAKGLVTKQHRLIKQVDVVPYLPQFKPKTIKNPNVQQSAQELQHIQLATRIINNMQQAKVADDKMFRYGKTAAHKLAVMVQSQPRLANLYVRNSFINQGGLNVLARNLQPVYDQDDNPQEPNMAMKLKVIRMINEFRLDSDVVKKNPELIRQISRNRQSRVIELSNTCRSLIDKWQIAFQRQDIKRNQSKINKK